MCVHLGPHEGYAAFTIRQPRKPSLVVDEALT
jgi:hypothetical protein